MIKDRGTKKWTAMMLPEHVCMVKKAWKDTEKQPKPEIDEQTIEEIERCISDASTMRSELVITYWDDGYFKMIIGRVHSIMAQQKALQIEDKFEMRYTVAFSNIIDIRFS